MDKEHKSEKSTVRQTAETVALAYIAVRATQGLVAMVRDVSIGVRTRRKNNKEEQ